MHFITSYINQSYIIDNSIEYNADTGHCILKKAYLSNKQLDILIKYICDIFEINDEFAEWLDKNNIKYEYQYTEDGISKRVFKNSFKLRYLLSKFRLETNMLFSRRIYATIPGCKYLATDNYFLLSLIFPNELMDYLKEESIELVLDKEDPEDFKEEYISKTNKEQMVQLLKYALVTENANVYSNLGTCYLRGDGVEIDYKTAIMFFNEAIKAGSIAGLSNMATMYQYGYGIKKDIKKAFRMYSEAALAGDTYSMMKLGNMYKFGIYVKQDYKMGNIYFTTGAKRGDNDCMMCLAISYNFGRGVRKNYKIAANLYGQLKDKIPQAAYNLAILFREHKMFKVRKSAIYDLFSKAMNKGFVDAYYEVAMMTLNGIGTEKDEEKALTILKKGADLGQIDCLSYFKNI